MSEIRKTILALIGAGLTWGTAVVNSTQGPIADYEWLALGCAIAGVIGVWAVPNASVPPSA